MEGRGRSRRRSPGQTGKRRLSSVLAVVLTAVMVLNMPLSIDGLQLHLSNAFASGSSAGQTGSVWATASNAKYRQGESKDVDIYVIANDNGAVPGNTTSMTLYLKNNTDQAISDGVLTFSGKYINKEDGSFQDVGAGEEYSQIITAGGPGQSAEESGEGLVYQENEDTVSVSQEDDTAGENTVVILPEDPGNEAADREMTDETDDEEAYKLENIDLEPGELHEVYFEFYTEDDVKSTKANVTFSFRGENEEGSRVTGETKFYYSIGLPNVNFSMEEGMQIESGVRNDLEIWMSEPDWVDEDLEERIQEQEDKKAEEEMKQAADEAEEDDGSTGSAGGAGTASDSQASRATDSNASKDKTASKSDAAKDTAESEISQKDAEKIEKYTEEAMEISESKVSYTVEIFGAKYSEFHARKTEEAEDIGWISCVYEVDRSVEPGIYYGKVTATGKWNKKDFTSEQGFLFEVTGEGKTGQEFTEELDNVIVHAYAEEGVLPENVQLKATELIENDAETGDQFQTAKDALDAEGTQYDGMMALDITFIDENGEEIEPVGEVQVSIEMKQGVLPEDVDLSTVEVHHLKEVDENTVEVEAVADGADKTDGTVKSADEAVAELEDAEVPEEEIKAAVSGDAAAVASFSVGSFSYFTITWTYRGSNQNKTLKINLIDEEGNPIPGAEDDALTKFSFSTSDTVTLKEEAPYIQNYTYVKAVFAVSKEDAVSEDATSIIQIQDRHQEWKGGIFGYWETVYEWRYCSSSGWNPDWKSFDPDEENIYLIYSKDESGSTGEGGGDSEVDLPEPQISKKAVSNEDGTYDLSLSVTGSIGSQSNTANVDVLMIVDESNSMTSNRIRNTKTAMKTLIDSLESQEHINARYSIYTFGSTARDEMQSWQAMPSDYIPNPGESYETQNFRNTIVGGAVNRIQNSGEGTNYEAALSAAAEQIKTARENAITVVIFLSDGQPSMSFNWGNGTSVMQSNSFWAWRETLETADDIYCNQFYSIGISADMEQFMGDTTDGYGGLINAVNAQTKGYFDTDSDGDELSKIFANIAGAVTDLFIKNVTITDNLNLDNVEPVLDTKGDVELTVLVSDGDSTTDDSEITAEEVVQGNIQPSYANGVLSLEFNDDYELKPGYTYTVTMKIKPTAEAEMYYAVNQVYPDTPTAEWDTGTHSHERGFFSNEKAVLTYYYTDNSQADGEQSLIYPMPVVQVQRGYLKLSKEMAEGISSGDEIFNFTLSIPETLAGYYNAQYSNSDISALIEFKAETNAATATVNLKAGEYIIISLPDGINVDIAELSDGYTASWVIDEKSEGTAAGVDVTISKASIADVKCINMIKISIPTGLNNYTKPYMLMLAGAVIILAGYSGNQILRRRKYR